MVEGARLEIVCAETYQGFESLPLRQMRNRTPTVREGTWQRKRRPPSTRDAVLLCGSRPRAITQKAFNPGMIRFAITIRWMFPVPSKMS